MGILDKLRPQSKSTHPDPNIRIEAVHEIDAGDLRRSSGFAKDDADARVRRAAVRASPSRRAGRHCPQRIRRQRARPRRRAAGRAGLEARRGVASPPCPRWPHSAASASWRAVAKAPVPRPCAARPLPRARQKSLGGIARHAAEASARLLAVERLTDAAEIEGVALRGEHADAAVAAVDRLCDPSTETLTAIARRRAPRRRRRRRARCSRRANRAPAPTEAGPAYKEADQQTARDLVAQMTRCRR